jgi:hypothetical protein
MIPPELQKRTRRVKQRLCLPAALAWCLGLMNKKTRSQERGVICHCPYCGADNLSLRTYSGKGQSPVMFMCLTCESTGDQLALIREVRKTTSMFNLISEAELVADMIDHKKKQLGV